METPTPIYAQRRAALMDRLGQGSAIFRSAPTAVMHADVDHVFRQDSDFFYLTGFNEPNAVAVLAPHHEHSFVLFVQPKDRERETWSGYRVGVEAAKAVYGADEAYPIGELPAKLPQYVAQADRIVFRPGHDQAFNLQILELWQRLLRHYPREGKGPLALEDPGPLLHTLRQIKGPEELDLMGRAIAISGEAHRLAQALAQPGCYEYEIQAAMEGWFRQQGALGPAYPSIVASGSNACILHYIENNRQMQDGELLLIDAGCSFGYYNADITRTFPVGDRFTAPQRAIYDLVLEAQEQAIAQIAPGKGYNESHDAAVRVITEGLRALGLLQGDVEELIEKGSYKPFFMHRTGHWLGLDVHDVGVYKVNGEGYTLQPGNVLTVEPGIYIAPDFQPGEGQPEVSEEWQGIGVRIEDDVLVTATGHGILTASVPKAVEALEGRIRCR